MEQIVPFTASALDQTLGKNLAPVILHSDGPFPYYIFPVHNGPLLAGCFVVELQRTLRPLDHDILEQGGAVVMLQLINTYPDRDGISAKKRFFEELLQYREPAELSDKIQRFGLSDQNRCLSASFIWRKMFRTSRRATSLCNV